MEPKPSVLDQVNVTKTDNILSKPYEVDLSRFKRDGKFLFEDYLDIEAYESTEEEKEALRASEEFQDVLTQKITALLVGGSIETYENIHHYLALGIHTPETLKGVQQVLVEVMIELLGKGNIKEFNELVGLNLHAFDINELPNLQSVIVQGMGKVGRRRPGAYVSNLELLLKLNLATFDTVQLILVRSMTEMLQKKQVEEFEFKKLFALSLHTTETLMLVYSDLLAGAMYSGITTLIQYSPLVKQKWQTFVAGVQQKAYDTSVPLEERRESQNVLVLLLQRGNISILEQITQDLKNRLETTGESPLTPQQETALYVFEKLNTQKTNTVLFDLLVAECLPQEHIDIVAHHLIKGETQFATKEIRKAMRKYLYQNQSEEGGFGHVSWKRGEYLQAFKGIQSTILREEAINSVGSMVFEIDNLENVHSQYPYIPLTALLQCISLNEFNPGFLEYIHLAYTTIRNSQSSQEKMLFSITKLLQTEHTARDTFVHAIQGIPCTTPEAVQKLNVSIRTFTFAAHIPNLLQQGGRRGYHNNDEQNFSNMCAQMFMYVNSFEELQRPLRDFVTSQIQSILPHEKITAEQFEHLEESWGDIEPILTYLGRYQNNKQYIAEIVAHADTEEHWKEWRYDVNRPTVEAQIGFLSDEERALWQKTSVQKIEATIQESDLSKPQQIQSHIIEAILLDKHLVEGEKKYEWSQKYLEGVLGKYEQVDQNKEAVLSQAIQNIQSYIDRIGEYVLSFDNTKIQTILKNTFIQGSMVSVSTKTKGALDNLKPYVDAEVFKGCINRYKEYEKNGLKQVKVEDIIPPEVYRTIEEKMISLPGVAQKLKEDNVWQIVGIEEKDIANRGVVYQKIRELAGVANILRLANMQVSHLMTNVLVEGKVKKEGLTVSGVIADLQKTYQGSSFVGNIKNIEAIVATTLEVRKDRSLAIILSDNPSLLWQAGKYPLGNGSCQEYAGGSMAESLMGYVADAHTKVLYMFDVNVLPQEAKDRMVQGESLEEVTNSLTPPDLLQSVVARSIIKLTKSGKKIPTLFIEPIYTTLNKQDHEMDRAVIEFLGEYVAKPMRGRIAKGGGSFLSVHFPASANPLGQYEDGAFGDTAHGGQGIQRGSYTLKTSMKADFSVDKK